MFKYLNILLHLKNYNYLFIYDFLQDIYVFLYLFFTIQISIIRNLFLKRNL